MKNQNLLFFPFLFALGIGLFSCNFGNSGNVSNYQNTPAVVSIDYTIGGNGILLGTPYGYFAAPELSNMLMDGECVYLQQFSIDYDNQLSDQYTTITNVVEVSVNQSLCEQSDTVQIGDYTLPLTNASGIASAYYKGKFFIGVTSNDNNPSLRLVYNNTKDDADGTKNVYLVAKPSGTGSSGTGAIQAFDLSALIRDFGRDTTVVVSGTSQSYDLKYISLNLNYLSGISSTGVPTYSPVSQQNPFLISVFRNQ